MRGARPACGFTLIELLAALAVLAVLAAAGYRTLGSLLEAQAHVDAQTRRWNDVAVLFSQVERDLSLASGRSVRDGAGHAQPALVAGDGALVLTRFGDADEGGGHAEPRRVGYRMRGDAVEYLVWPALDTAPSAAPMVHRVFEGATEFRLTVLGGDGRPVPSWPLAGATALPRGVSAELTLPGGERVTRLFLLR